MYLERNDALSVIERMRIFENALKTSFENQGYDLRENLGRRNILLSMSQEKETANVLRRKFKEVESDGAPGKPDVVIHDINKELECKLTSGSKTKGSVSFALQTDWATLKKKGKLDYAYILCNDSFDEFCFAFFDGLTTDDFFPPANGSRGKSRMNKAKAMRKLRCLVGGVESVSEKHIEKINKEYQQKSTEMTMRMSALAKRCNELSPKATVAKGKIEDTIQNERNRYVASLNKLLARKKYWENHPAFSFKFEKVSFEEKKEGFFMKLYRYLKNLL